MRHRIWWFGAFVIAVGAALTLNGKDQKSHDWPAYSADKGSTKYSPLDQINKDTVGKLQIAWRQAGVPAELKAIWPDANAPTNWQNTPIMVDGLLYMHSGVGAVVALDASTGKVVWYDVPPHDEGKPPARGNSTRGVAYWKNGDDSRIFTMNGAALVALNARTGKRYADWGSNGIVDLTKVGYDRGGVTGYRNSSGPIVVRDVVIVGGVPAPATDYLNERVKATKEAPPDDVRGFDAKTGKLLWTFHVVPRPGEFGDDSWLDKSIGLLGQQRRVVAAERRRRARLRLPADRRSDGRLLRRHASRQQSVRRKHRVSRCEDRQARLALPDAASRLLGLRPACRADSRRHHRERPHDQGAGAGHQAGVHVSCSTA